MASTSPPPGTQPTPPQLWSAFMILTGGRAHREALEEALRRRKATGEGYCVRCRRVQPHVNDADVCDACMAPPHLDAVVWTCTAYHEGGGACNRAVTVADQRAFSATQSAQKECALCWLRNPLAQLDQ